MLGELLEGREVRVGVTSGPGAREAWEGGERWDCLANCGMEAAGRGECHQNGSGGGIKDGEG